MRWLIQEFQHQSSLTPLVSPFNNAVNVKSRVFFKIANKKFYIHATFLYSCGVL